MSFKQLGEMFEGDSADMCGRKFPRLSLGGLVEGPACRDSEARTPIVVSGHFLQFLNLMPSERICEEITNSILQVLTAKSAFCCLSCQLVRGGEGGRWSDRYSSHRVCRVRWKGGAEILMI